MVEGMGENARWLGMSGSSRLVTLFKVGIFNSDQNIHVGWDEKNTSIKV